MNGRWETSTSSPSRARRAPQPSPEHPAEPPKTKQDPIAARLAAGPRRKPNVEEINPGAATSQPTSGRVADFVSELHRSSRPPSKQSAAPTAHKSTNDSERPIPRWRQVLAWIVDAAVILTAGAGVAWLQATLFDETHPVWAVWFLDRWAAWIHQHAEATLTGVVTSMLVALIYTAYHTQRGGRTLGRRIAGIVLVRRSGRPMNGLLTTLRTILCTFSWLAFGAGFFWVVVDRRARTLHDVLSGTVLQRTR
ncbi:MAG: RDD family protein [Myxococcota bacterium]